VTKVFYSSIHLFSLTCSVRSGSVRSYLQLNWCRKASLEFVKFCLPEVFWATSWQFILLWLLTLPCACFYHAQPSLSGWLWPGAVWLIYSQHICLLLGCGWIGGEQYGGWPCGLVIFLMLSVEFRISNMGFCRCLPACSIFPLRLPHCVIPLPSSPLIPLALAAWSRAKGCPGGSPMRVSVLNQ
jgi:hypothetical protein